MRTWNRLAIVTAMAVGTIWTSLAWSYDELVEKKTFTMPTYTTIGGKTIKNVKIGYETYGRLNAAGTNAIFIPHYFTGTSHAAGKYAATDAAAGYWDSIIGAGKPLDTDKYFIVSADTLVNLNTKDPHVVTTGPASIDPDTGKPYGMTFPIVTFRDMVNTQKALVDSLGIKRLKAVMGASGGSMQTMEWAASYPEMVERAIPVIPGGVETSGYLVETLNTWMAPILNDPKWNKGDYYGKEEPVQGVAESLKLITMASRHYGWAEKAFGRKFAAADKNPLDSWDNAFAIESVLDKATAAGAKKYDANSLLYTARANQLYRVHQDATLEEGVKRIKAKVLFIPAKSDLLLFPDYSKKAMEMLSAQGNKVEYFELQGDGGHLDGLFQIGQAGETIREFLTK
ncbi:MAG: E22 family MetX-like putative esterase [Burkholderiaceae bacterium]